MAVTFDAAHSSPTDLVINDTSVTVASGITSYRSALSVLSQSTGKRYFEVTVNSFGGSGSVSIGLATQNVNLNSIAGTDGYGVGYSWFDTSFRSSNVQSGSFTLGTRTAGIVIGVAVDFDNREIWFRGSNGLWNGVSTDDPATNTGGVNKNTLHNLNSLLSNTLYIDVSVYNGSSATLNVGASAFTYAVPSGFTAWNTTAAAYTPTAYRYWSVKMDQFHSAGGGAVTFETIFLRNAAGVNLATDGTKASATNDGGGSYPASAAIAGASGFWAATGGSTPIRWIYDFTTPVTINSIGGIARSDSYSQQAPPLFNLQGSNDGTTWTNVLNVSTSTWGQADNRQFDVVPPVVSQNNGHRYWALKFNTVNNANGYIAASRITLAGADGTNLVLNPNQASATSTDSIYKASNSITGPPNFWVSVASAVPGARWVYDFGSGNTADIRRLTYTGRSGQSAQNPISFDVQYSDTNNGTDWTTAWSVTNAVFPDQTNPVTFTSSAGLVTVTPGAILRRRARWPRLHAVPPSRFWPYGRRRKQRVLVNVVVTGDTGMVRRRRPKWLRQHLPKTPKLGHFGRREIYQNDDGTTSIIYRWTMT